MCSPASSIRNVTSRCVWRNNPILQQINIHRRKSTYKLAFNSKTILIELVYLSETGKKSIRKMLMLLPVFQNINHHTLRLCICQTVKKLNKSVWTVRNQQDPVFHPSLEASAVCKQLSPVSVLCSHHVDSLIIFQWNWFSPCISAEAQLMFHIFSVSIQLLIGFAGNSKSIITAQRVAIYKTVLNNW